MKATGRKPRWAMAQAKQRLSEVVRAASREPQLILSHARPVAIVVSPEEFDAYRSWREQRHRPTLAALFDELRRVCAEERYLLAIPARRDRSNPFAE